MSRFITRRTTEADKRPLANDTTGLRQGELGLNIEDTSPGLYFRSATDEIIKIGPIHVGPTAPNITPPVGGTTGNSIGEAWLNTIDDSLNVWDGTQWVQISGGGGGTPLTVSIPVEDLWMYA